MQLTRGMVARAGIIAALVGLEVYLAHSMTSAPSIRGYVDTHSYAVSSAQKGLVRRIDVALGERVSAGQVVVELDHAALDAEIAERTTERRALVIKARAGEGDDEALRSVDAKLEALADRRDATRLRAPADGVVEAINAHPGDAVTSDAPIAMIVTADTQHVIACIPEQRVGEVVIGSSAVVTSSVHAVSMAGVVESLTPAIAELPPRCQNVVAKPVAYGRLAVVRLDGATSALPGESELVAFGAPRATPVPATSDSAAIQPQPIDVPTSLAAISRVEASGLVWEPSLDRYVVVSDETGDKGQHAPWLFAMSRRGVLDPEPIVVADVAALDDIESIASDEHGGLWICASQSLSQAGKRPAARELLAHLVPDGYGFKVDKQVQLAPLLAGLPGVDLAKLDIEGLAFRGGSLYLGFKAPLDGGRATIWKIAAPDRLLASDVAGAGMSVFARVALPDQMGIADMMFLSDTTLAVAGTTQAGSGGMFLVAVGRGDASVTPLQQFPGLRPEGVALSPLGKLAVVFDRGKDVPLWTELEVPHVSL